MGFKARPKRAASADIGSFVAGIAPDHKANFDALHTLIQQVAPQASQSLKWGTLAYDLNGSLFALSASKKVVNLYILTLGVIAQHKSELVGIPQSNCVLRFAPDRELPMAALTTVMKVAIAHKTA